MGRASQQCVEVCILRLMLVVLPPARAADSINAIHTLLAPDGVCYISTVTDCLHQNFMPLLGLVP
jgi:hypothetical protein